MVGSVKKVTVALKSAKICSSSHVPNSILKNAPKWLVYADMVTSSKKHFIKMYRNVGM